MTDSMIVGYAAMGGAVLAAFGPGWVGVLRRKRAERARGGLQPYRMPGGDL